MATIDIVRDVLVENQDLDPEAITEDAVIEDLGIDSLDMVELHLRHRGPVRGRLRRADRSRDHRRYRRAHRLPEVGRSVS